MKTAIREIPSDLPHAQLYLDDLVEIENIVKKVIDSEPKTSVEGFEYRVDDRIQMTTHEELIEHQGSSDTFDLIAVTSSYGSTRRTEILRFYRSLHPRMSFYWGGAEDRWAVHALIAQVFEPRKLRLKNVLDSVPFFGKVVLGGLYGWVMAALLIAGFRNGMPHESSRIAEACAGSIVLLIWLTTMYVDFLVASRINFRHSRPDFNARKDARRELLQKIVLLAIGAVFGFLGTLIASYFKKN